MYRTKRPARPVYIRPRTPVYGTCTSVSNKVKVGILLFNQTSNSSSSSWTFQRPQVEPGTCASLSLDGPTESHPMVTLSNIESHDASAMGVKPVPVVRAAYSQSLLIINPLLNASASKLFVAPNVFAANASLEVKPGKTVPPPGTVFDTPECGIFGDAR
jgi:hypothetical protein